MVLVVDAGVVGQLGDVHDGSLRTLVDGGVVLQLIGVLGRGHDAAVATEAIHADVHGHGGFQLIGGLGGDSNLILHAGVVGAGHHGFLGVRAIRVDAVLNVHEKLRGHGGIVVGGSIHFFGNSGAVLGAVDEGEAAVAHIAAIAQSHETDFIGVYDIHAVSNVALVVRTAQNVGRGHGGPAGAVIAVGVDNDAVINFVEGAAADGGNILHGVHSGALVVVLHKPRVRFGHVIHSESCDAHTAESHSAAQDARQNPAEFLEFCHLNLHCNVCLVGRSFLLNSRAAGSLPRVGSHLAGCVPYWALFVNCAPPPLSHPYLIV